MVICNAVYFAYSVSRINNNLVNFVEVNGIFVFFEKILLLLLLLIVSLWITVHCT